MSFEYTDHSLSPPQLGPCTPETELEDGQGLNPLTFGQDVFSQDAAASIAQGTYFLFYALID